MREITDHCDKLMNTTVDQLKAIFNNCLMHVAADLNVPAAHESVSIVKNELKGRLALALDSL